MPRLSPPLDMVAAAAIAAADGGGGDNTCPLTEGPPLLPECTWSALPMSSDDGSRDEVFCCAAFCCAMRSPARKARKRWVSTS